MDIIIKLTIKFMLKNKKRTITTISGIVLSIILQIVIYVSYNILCSMYAAGGWPTEEINKIMMGIIVISLLVSGVIIYNSYAISMNERKRYIALLGSVGATRIQKAACIVGEGLLEWLIAVPAGLTLGCKIGKVLVEVTKQYLYENKYLVFELDVKQVVMIIISSAIAVGIATFGPTIKAGKMTVLDISGKNYSQKDVILRKVTSLTRPHPILGTEGMLALKNILLERAKYVRMGMLMILLLCLVLDGYVYWKAQAGDYYLQDQRTRPSLDFWMELHTEDSQKIENIYAELGSIEEIQSVSLERTLDLGGILIEEECIKEEYQDYYLNSVYGYVENPKTITDSQGKCVTGYLFQCYVIGIDDAHFEEYLQKSMGEVTDSMDCPIIIDNYFMMADGDDYGNAEYYSILNLKEGEQFSFYYSKYGDMDFPSIYPENQVDNICEGTMDVAGITDEAVPIPYYSKMYTDINGYKERESGYMHVYMPLSKFEEFIRSEMYRQTYGKYDVENGVLKNHWEEKNIVSYIKFSTGNSTDEVKGGIFEHQKLGQKCNEDTKILKTVKEVMEKNQLKESSMYGLDLDHIYDYMPIDETFAVDSLALWTRRQMMEASDLLLELLAVGIGILMVCILMTVIIQQISVSIQLRSREFAILLSLGMSRKKICKMIWSENAISNLSFGLIGMVISFLVMNNIFSEVKKAYAANIVTPVWLMGIQVLIIALTILLPTMQVILATKNMNPIERIKNENV